jgi:hypothetical protein
MRWPSQTAVGALRENGALIRREWEGNFAAVAGAVEDPQNGRLRMMEKPFRFSDYFKYGDFEWLNVNIGGVASVRWDWLS